MKRYFIGSLLLFVLFACTTKSDTYYNRQFRKVPTKYNVLYNGNMALEEGLASLQGADTENYFEILPVEPLLIDAEQDGKVEENPHFARAEEKAIKAIQKHSMVFDGKQKNARIDDAYMLLGKARFYNRRYVPALDAFNHLIYNYGETNRKGEAMLWREKVYMQLGREQLAMENLQKHLTDTLLKKKDRSYLKALLGEGLVKEKRYKEAIAEIKQAAYLVQKKPIKGRYFFILAQLHEQIGAKDSAVAYFDKVIAFKRKVPRRLWIEAQLGKARNARKEKDDIVQIIKMVEKQEKQEKQYENKNHLSSLYYAHANLLQEKGDITSAIAYYVRSLKENKGNTAMKKHAHLRAASLYFAEKDFVKAHHHYDSALVFIPDNKMEHLQVRRKRDNLSEIARYDAIVSRIDSLLHLTKMNDAQRVAYFQQLQKAPQIAVVQQKKGSSASGIAMAVASGESAFYFYNQQVMEYGRVQFEKEYGTRPLVDNWKYSAILSIQEQEQASNEQVQAKENSYELFLKQLPTKEQVVQLEMEQAKALLWLGQAYWDKFKEVELSSQSFHRLLKEKHTQEQEQVALYYLYNMYRDGNGLQAEQYSKLLQEKYPDGVYARTIKGEPMSLEHDFASDTERINKLIEEQNYKAALTLIEEKKSAYEIANNVEQWELLQASAKGRLEGVQAYRVLLKELQDKYPKNESYKLMIAALPEVTIPFIKVGKNGGWKLLIRNAASHQKNEVKKWLESNGRAAIKVTIDAYNYAEDFLVLHGFYNLDEANGVFYELNRELPHIGKNGVIIINTENYFQVQRNKSIEDYKKWLEQGNG